MGRILFSLNTLCEKVIRVLFSREARLTILYLSPNYNKNISRLARKFVLIPCVNQKWACESKIN